MAEKAGMDIAIIAIPVVFSVMNSFLSKFLAFAATLVTATVAVAGTNNLTLAWDAIADQDAGYIVYWGTASGVYDQQSDAEDQTSQTILNLTVGAQYYFAVTAYNQDGMESDFSE